MARRTRTTWRRSRSPRREQPGQVPALGGCLLRWNGLVGTKRQTGSHKVLAREGWPDVVFAFHDGEEIGPRMLARLAKTTGVKPTDL
jgi:predicted RNA binding protein YcfA (HicA-like mRNA interferase family)